MPLRYDNGTLVEKGDFVTFTEGPIEDWDHGEVVHVESSTVGVMWDGSGYAEQEGVENFVAYHRRDAAERSYHRALAEERERTWEGSQERGALLRDIEVRHLTPRVRNLARRGVQTELRESEVERLGQGALLWLRDEVGVGVEDGDYGAVWLVSRA